jgi:small-conductance mechanosensitive channel
LNRIIIVGLLLLAEVWSVPYTSVLAGLGIGGLAVALAAQPTLQNMIAGFTLFADMQLENFTKRDRILLQTTLNLPASWFRSSG